MKIEALKIALLMAQQLAIPIAGMPLQSGENSPDGPAVTAITRCTAPVSTLQSVNASKSLARAHPQHSLNS